MREFSLVRHGRTAHNAAHRLLGWTDVALDEVGEAQARALGACVDIERYDSVWSSDLTRATSTARIAGWPLSGVDWRLREIDFGELEGSTWDDLDTVLRDALVAFDGFVAPGGESVAAFVDRITSFFEERAPGVHMIVTHGGVIRAAMRLCGESGAFAGHGVVYTVDWDRRSTIDLQTPTT